MDRKQEKLRVEEQEKAPVDKEWGRRAMKLGWTMLKGMDSVASIVQIWVPFG